VKEWEIYLKKKEKISRKEYLGTVVASSPEEAIELFFEPEELKINHDNSLEIIERNSSNVFEYKKGKLKKI